MRSTPEPIQIAIIVQGNCVQAVCHMRKGGEAMIPIEVEVIDYDAAEVAGFHKVAITQSGGGKAEAGCYRAPTYFSPAAVRDAFAAIAAVRNGVCDEASAHTEALERQRPSGGGAEPLLTTTEGLILDGSTMQILGHEDNALADEEEAEAEREARFAYFSSHAEARCDEHVH